MCNEDEEEDTMGGLVKLPKKDSNFSMVGWLNSHAGCDVNKMMNGNSKEKKKSELHFAKETLKARSALINDNKKRK